VTHLRKLMLEELQRLNTLTKLYAVISIPSRISLDDSTVPRTAWVLGTFVNIRPSYFENGSCPRARWRSVWRPCGSSTPRL
jgi:hypothetical protein